MNEINDSNAPENSIERADINASPDTSEVERTDEDHFENTEVTHAGHKEVEQLTDDEREIEANNPGRDEFDDFLKDANDDTDNSGKIENDAAKNEPTDTSDNGDLGNEDGRNPEKLPVGSADDGTEGGPTKPVVVSHWGEPMTTENGDGEGNQENNSLTPADLKKLTGDDGSVSSPARSLGNAGEVNEDEERNSTENMDQVKQDGDSTAVNIDYAREQAEKEQVEKEKEMEMALKRAMADWQHSR